VNAPRLLVERFYKELWNDAREEVAGEILDEGFRFRGSLGPERFGLEGFLDYLRSIHAALGGYTCTIDDLVESGNRAAARMRFRGTHRGSFFGIPATGRTVEWAGAAFFTTDGKRITELWVLGDVDALKAQLGAGPASAFSE
jgi:predicted ester cyclase